MLFSNLPTQAFHARLGIELFFFSLFRLASPSFFLFLIEELFKFFLKSETDEYILKSSSSRLARLKLITHRSEQL